MLKLLIFLIACAWLAYINPLFGIIFFFGAGFLWLAFNALTTMFVYKAEYENFDDEDEDYEDEEEDD
ncbi:MAG: hypothetical protein HAW64_02700 [Alphaproteobacteria bacterium]|nr:hypothetical protein [Alphaproteobacteria bacterium]